MNRIYCTVWNRVRHAWVVVSETTRHSGKGRVQRSCGIRNLVRAAVAAAGLAVIAAPAYAVDLIIVGTTSDIQISSGQSYNSVTVTDTAVVHGSNIGISNSGSITTLNNNNLIGAGYYGIYNFGTVGTINNAGTLSSDRAYALLNYGTLDVLNNTGTINASWGYTVVNQQGTITSINNSGIISTSDPSSAALINNSTIGSITNSGTIIGNITSVSTLTFIGGDGSTVGTLTGYTPNATPATGTITLTGGDLIFSSGNMLLNDNVTLTSGTLKNTGANLYVANPLAISGNYSQSSGASLHVSVSSADSSSGYGKLSVSGTATLGGTLAVDVASGNTLVNGDTLAGVIHANSIVGTFANVTDNSALFDFSASYTATDVNLNVRQANLVSAAVNATGNTQAAGAAGALDRVIGSDPTGPIASVLMPLSTQQAVSKAATQTLPLLSGNSTVVAQNALGRFGGIVQSRLDGLRGLSSGDAVFADREMWIKPFGSWADQHDRGGVSGYSANTGGMALGADTALSSASRVGVSFGYARTSASSNSTDAPQSATVDVFQLLGYGSSRIDANTEFSYQAGIGQNHTTGQRTLSFASGNAKASYHSLTATAGVGLEKTWKLNEQTSFLPSLRADYSWIKDRAYSETGSASVAPLLLNVASRSADELILSVNGKLNHKLSDATTFSVNAGAGYDAINQQVSISSSFAGAPGISFVTYGLDQSPWLARAGLGLVHKSRNGVEFNARYDAEYRSGYLNHSASLKASWAF